MEKLLARGGVGVVYAAEDIEEKGGRNARVVIKVLSPERVGDSQAEGRFERESKRLNQLFHPNIVRLIATGREPGGRAFMVMEYVDGETLEAYLATRKRLDIEDFAPIAAQILKAIGYAHSQGMVHRDLKPANIMLCTRNGRANVVKILDFGLARLIEGDQQITTDQVVGTAGFLAPEQFDGRPIDQRVDVYALGILFYTMLAGRQPFVAETGAALMYKHLHEAPEPLGQALPPTHGVPDGVISLVMQALSKEPQARPESANELTERLFECVHAT
ncbi:MAG: serine/threonine protein kinase, partial [Nannocystaceae bacterium]